MIIVLVGLARSGKDTVADYIVKKYNFKHFDFAKDALFPEADKRGIEKDKISLSLLGDQLRQESGQGVLGKIIAEKINETKQENFVLTGPRSPEEIDYVRNSFDNELWVVEVYSDKLTRYQRRTEKDPDNMEEFFSRDKRDIHNKGLGKVLKMSDIKIENEGTLEELYQKTDELMKRLGAEK